MKPTHRTLLSLVPLILQFGAMTSALAVISFFLPPLESFLKKHAGEFSVPAPTHLLVSHPETVKAILVGLFFISAICFFVSRVRMKEEADQLAI